MDSEMILSRDPEQLRRAENDAVNAYVCHDPKAFVKKCNLFICINLAPPAPLEPTTSVIPQRRRAKYAFENEWRPPFAVQNAFYA